MHPVLCCKTQYINIIVNNSYPKFNWQLIQCLKMIITRMSKSHQIAFLLLTQPRRMYHIRDASMLASLIICSLEFQIAIWPLYHIVQSLSRSLLTIYQELTVKKRLNFVAKVINLFTIHFNIFLFSVYEFGLHVQILYLHEYWRFK